MTLANFPESERKHVRHIDSLLLSLQQHARQFRVALDLFNYAAEHAPPPTKDNASRSRFHEWMFLAAKEGVMCIFHFGKTADGIRADLGKFPAINATFDRDALRAANKLFLKHFPRYKQFRNAISHEADLIARPEGVDVHAVGNNGSNVMYVNCLEGRRFFTTFEGDVLSYEINETTAQVLDSVKLRYNSAFQSLIPYPGALHEVVSGQYIENPDPRFLPPHAR